MSEQTSEQEWAVPKGAAEPRGKVAKLVERLAPLFPMRFDTDEQYREWFRGYVRALAGHDEGVLEKAGHRIVAEARTTSRGYPRFPLPGDIIAICEAIERDRRQPELMREQAQAEKAWPFSRERKRLAIDLMRGEMGRRAVREGWVGVLYTTVCEHGRLPEERDTPTLRRRAQEHFELVRDCLSGQCGPLSKTLGQLGLAMERRAALVAAIIEGRAATEDLFKNLRDVDLGDEA